MLGEPLSACSSPLQQHVSRRQRGRAALGSFRSISLPCPSRTAQQPHWQRLGMQTAFEQTITCLLSLPTAYSQHPASGYGTAHSCGALICQSSSFGLCISPFGTTESSNIARQLGRCSRDVCLSHISMGAVAAQATSGTRVAEGMKQSKHVAPQVCFTGHEWPSAEACHFHGC